LIGRGEGIHWSDLDEDISIEGLLAGNPSGEGRKSFKKWLAKRENRITSQPLRHEDTKKEYEV